MGTTTIESTVLISCGRPEVYAFCLDLNARAAIPGTAEKDLHFQDQVPERSWTETCELRGENVTRSCVLNPLAAGTRLTVTAKFVPKGLGRIFSAAREGSYRKQEAARLAALKRAVERRSRTARE